VARALNAKEPLVATDGGTPVSASSPATIAETDVPSPCISVLHARCPRTGLHRVFSVTLDEIAGWIEFSGGGKARRSFAISSAPPAQRTNDLDDPPTGYFDFVSPFLVSAV
jgi:hypothetical protein